jgi:hypothetical protein
MNSVTFQVPWKMGPPMSASSNAFNIVKEPPRRSFLVGIEFPGTGHVDRFVECFVVVPLYTGVAYQGKTPLGGLGQVQRPE